MSLKIQWSKSISNQRIFGFSGFWCQDGNHGFQKKYCPTSVTFPIEILMEANKPGLRRKMSLNLEAEQSKHFSEISDYQDSKVGKEINDFLEIAVQLKNSWLRSWSKYSSSQLARKMCLKVEMKYNWKHKLNISNKHCKLKKPTTLQSKGLPWIESLELRLGWKWIMPGLSRLR